MGEESITYSAVDTRERKKCVCGSRVFVKLDIVEVLPREDCESVILLQSFHGHEKAGWHLPMVECLVCRTRYNRRWHPVV